MARGHAEPAQTSPDVIVDELEVLLTRLSGNIDELVDRVKPANVAKRQVQRIKEYFVDEQTGPRYEHIVPVVVGTVGTIAGFAVLRRLLK
ncbi:MULTISPECIES: DUF3618 domain-containing protein [Aeromicrobium]|uniref:DUF3618 domain-containing protein n=1 Tax=Aeromicrobium phoceense TaxID=2754045 RepID=A0A838XCQ5_9ACTN|nr:MULTISPECIES: DUF3618 domain-containing protein [Aeromicrobium]MBA4608315.1 DUF3618 domain-containing protein [Aeromicrobium phoceense]